MSTLAALKLVATKKLTQQSPALSRRNKICAKLDEQIQLAVAQNEGRTYSPTRIKTVTNAAGERVRVTQPKRMKPWWFVGENGKVCVEIRYGARTIELSKGKSAIEISGPSALADTFETVKAAVLAGELDAQIEAASIKLREGFAK